MVTLRDGRLPADVEHPLGLWFRDCRFLCAHELRICGQLPRLLTATDAAGTAGGPRAHEPGPRAGERRAAARRERSGIRIERRAEATGALRQRISVRSYHRAPIRLPLELRLGADFLPMLELRGIVPRHERAPPDAGPDGFSHDRPRRRPPHDRAARHAGAAGGRATARSSSTSTCQPRGGIDLTLDFEVSEHVDGEVAVGDPAAAATRTERRSPPTTSSSTASSSARSTTSSCCTRSSTASPTTPPACPGSRRCSAATA